MDQPHNHPVPATGQLEYPLRLWVAMPLDFFNSLLDSLGYP